MPPQLIDVRPTQVIFGVGPVLSRKFAEAGVHTVADVTSLLHDPFNRILRLPGGGLFRLPFMANQGIRYVRRLRDKLPRRLITQLASFVRSVLPAGFHLTVAGSYRRRSLTCNDADFLVKYESVTDRSELSQALRELVRVLHDNQFLVGDLVQSMSTFYMGVCQLPAAKTRGRDRSPLVLRPGELYRVDIRIVGPDHYRSTALLSGTGSADFNQSLRDRARELGYRLTAGAIENRETGEPVENIYTERDIFKFLNIPYIPPQMRS